MSYLPLLLAVSVLTVDGLIELSMVSSMVGWLHTRAGKFFTIDAPGDTFNLHGKPKGLLVNQGHTSNGAAGTAIVLIGIGGFLTIWLERRRQRKVSGAGHSGLFIFWVVMTWLSAGLTLAALIFTFIVTHQTDGQSINLTVAEANPEPAMYPLDNWTPENWLKAVLKLPLAHQSDRNTIRYHLDLMEGWRWNLIPLFVLGLVVALLALMELIRGRRWTVGESREKFRHSAQSASTTNY